ncbi:hypothetical protein VZT92_002321 [Zoarces viviparus]|uniref:Uncharacterized protein n=1 Tax=Zoarces viviparus TaxID=48416 RepID=A0AAW1FZQ3_ZOAVI
MLYACVGLPVPYACVDEAARVSERGSERAVCCGLSSSYADFTTACPSGSHPSRVEAGGSDADIPIEGNTLFGSSLAFCRIKERTGESWLPCFADPSGGGYITGTWGGDSGEARMLSGQGER